MRGLHPATLVVLKLRFSFVVCWMVMPTYLSSYTTRHPRNHFLFARLDHQTGTPPFLLVSQKSAANPKLLVSALRQTESDGQDPVDRLRQLREKALHKLKTFLQSGKSLIRHVVPVPFRKTEMEAGFQQPTAPELLVLENATDLEESITTATSSYSEEESLPKGPRWVIAHPSTDLTGTWVPLIDSEFQNVYRQYLENCGTSLVFRQVCLNFCGVTRERIEQAEQGRLLHLHGKSPAGGWKRTLVSSGADIDKETYEPVHSEFFDPDKELVKVEAWWEEQGTVHKSWLRNKPGVAGGEFESTRYLKDNQDGSVELICESIFHPSESDRNNPSSKFKPGFVRWRYRKES
jgi:hypothetical protein